MDLLGDAVRFMQTNWPEWLGGPPSSRLPRSAGWGWLVSGGAPSPALVIKIIEIFGPFFGFIRAGAVALGVAGTGTLGIASAVLVLVFVHAFMLFRGSPLREAVRFVAPGSRLAGAQWED